MLISGIYDRDVDVMIRRDVDDVFAAIDALCAFLSSDKHKALKGDFGALAKGVEWFAIGRWSGASCERMAVRASKGNAGVLLDLRLYID